MFTGIVEETGIIKKKILNLDGMELTIHANKVLEDAKVAITPGLDFDPKNGHSTIRFSYARSTEDIIRGLDKLNIFMKNNKYI